jgi:wobble nucleotide-excising tRNase
MQLNNDEGNIGIITNERQIENLEEQTKIFFKAVDKLEQRISTLEKVLQSHAKCIGQIREVITDDI